MCLYLYIVFIQILVCNIHIAQPDVFKYRNVYEQEGAHYWFNTRQAQRIASQLCGISVSDRYQGNDKMIQRPGKHYL